MSAALVRKGLEIVDSESRQSQSSKKAKHVFDLIPENQKLLKKIKINGNKTSQKVNLMSASKKLTVIEAKRTKENKKTISKENLKKLKLIKEIGTVKLDKGITEKIIERAVTKRFIKKRTKPKKEAKTVFTEEDFKKFEEEYVD